MAKDVKITFDTLFSILRVEKSRDEIQELDPAFFDDVVEYLNEKKELLNKETDGLNVFIDNEKERNLKQLSNIKRVLNEIYERREKKIIDMALVKSRTNSDVISSAGLLESEAKLYDALVGLFDNFRHSVLFNVMGCKKVDLKDLEPVVKDDIAEKADSALKKVKFLFDVPKFVGENLEVYGPFEQEEVAELPSEIANLLVVKGRAQEA